MGWDRLSGTGFDSAQKIVQRPTPFLTRHFASRLGGVTPMNNFNVTCDMYNRMVVCLNIICNLAILAASLADCLGTMFIM